MSLFSDFLNFLKFRKETEKLELEVKKLQQEITDRGSSIIKPTFDDIKKYASGLAEPSASSKSPPIRDQRELFFLVRPFRFYPLDFGIAIGIGAAIFMFFYIFITFVMNRFGAGTASLVFFEQIFPGFHLDFAASAQAE